MNYSVCRLLMIFCLVCWIPISQASNEDSQGNDEPAATAGKPGPIRNPSNKKKNPPKGQTDSARRLTAEEVEEWVSRLPKVFNNKFREQYRQSLLNGDVPAEPGSDDIKHKMPESGGLSVNLNAIARPMAAQDTMQERIVNVVEVPSSNTRFVFVERSRAEPSPSSAKKEEPSPSQNRSESMQATQAAAAGGLPTIIASRSSGLATWQISRTPAPKWDTARAERGFKTFDTYLPGASVAEGTAPAAPTAAAVAAKPETKKESRSDWKEEIVYIDHEPTDESKPAGASRSGRSIATTSWEASVRGEDASFSLLARDAFYSLRKRAYAAPLAGILVNLMLMVMGIVLMFLMMAKRRRIATIGYPPAAARRVTETVRPPAPPQAAYPHIVAEQQVKYSENTPFVDHDSVDTKTDLTAQTSMNDDIRVVFDPHLCRWVLKREEYGRLSATLAELQVGSVVRGTALGTNSPEKRYRLSLTNTWIPTAEQEQIIIAVKAQNFRSRA